MKKMKLVQFISIGGLLTSLAVLFQSAPVFLPALGLALSPLSTLPIAIAAIFNVLLGMIAFFSSALILILISPQEAMIFLFSTGLIGIVLGAFLYRKGRLFSILASAMALTIGMLVLTYIAVIPAFVEFTESISLLLTMIIYIIFSIVYMSILTILLGKFAYHLIKIKLIEKPEHYVMKYKDNRK